jgi:predicted tellurium resistance membrane protein TerC
MDFSFGTQDFATVGVLVFLEGVLSIDNALILAMIARDLPEHQRPKALNYGMAGAFIFRAIAIALAGFLMKWTAAQKLFNT